MKKIIITVAMIATLCCVLALSVFAAEPSSSNEFGETTLITDNDAINTKDDFGYSEGDTARVVLQIPDTDTYITYPMYYCFSVRNDGKYGMQPVPDFKTINTASGYEFTVASIIRLEIPDYFTAVSTNYTNSNQMTNLKYVKLNENFIYIHSSAFSSLKYLEEVVFEENSSEEISLVIGDKAFEFCTALTNLSLPTHTTTVGERAFQGCTSLKTIDLNSRLTATGVAAFIDCVALETINIPESNSLTTVSHRSFENCKALTGTYVFENVTTIGTQAFRYSSTNDNCELVLHFPNVVTLGSSSGDTHIFSSSGLKEIYLGSSLKVMSFNTFTSCKKLVKIQIDAVDPSMTTFPSYTFEACSALKAFSIPEGITKLPSRMFSGCTSLTAVYLPSTLTTIDTGSQSHSTFYNCTNMYFVSEPFTFTSDSDIPAKEDVYYFPENLETIAGGELFKACQKLNNTLVFGEKVTSITNAWAFNAGTNSPTLENIVFLGNMTDASTSNATSYWNFTGKIYFANENDKSTSDLTIKGLDSRVVFCYADGNTTHLKELSKSTEATCTMPKMTADYCFCGQYIAGTEATEGDALGHSMGEEYYVFNSLIEKGKTCKDCERCNAYTEEAEHENAILTDFGFSVKKFGSTYSFTNGYYVDKDLLNKYEITKGVSVGFGFAFNAEADFEYDGTLDSFKILAPIRNVGTGEKDFSAYTYQLTYADDTHINDNLILGAYVIENNGESETLSFVNMTDGEFERVSYKIALEKVTN